VVLKPYSLQTRPAMGLGIIENILYNSMSEFSGLGIIRLNRELLRGAYSSLRAEVRNNGGAAFVDGALAFSRLLSLCFLGRPGLLRARLLPIRSRRGGLHGRSGSRHLLFVRR
jgi:hypothetical protein